MSVFDHELNECGMRGNRLFDDDKVFFQQDFFIRVIRPIRGHHKHDYNCLSKTRLTGGNGENGVSHDRQILCSLRYLLFKTNGLVILDSGWKPRQSLLNAKPSEAESLLVKLTADPDATSLFPFIRALQAIVTGSRVRTLADASELSYSMSAEILFLIETMEKEDSDEKPGAEN